MNQTGELSRRDRLGQVSLIVIGLQSACVGLWAAAAPRSFTREFPGFGLHWIDPTAGFDEHFVRDVGVLQLALFVLALLAFRDTGLRRVTGIVWTVFAVPHLAYHASHTAGLPPLAVATSLVALSLSAAAGLLLATTTRRLSSRGGARSQRSGAEHPNPGRGKGIVPRP